MQYYFAPLEGVTDYIYRGAQQRRFPGADKYFAPFLSPTQDGCFSPRELRQVLPENNRGLNLTPQLLTARASDLLWAAAYLADLGYREVNLNLGCPSGTVTAKGKGCALLAYPERLQALLEQIFNAPLLVSGRVRLSVKTRLGWDRADEFADLLSVFRRYPLAELIVHARCGREAYRPGVHGQVFSLALDDPAWPLCYNGDLFSVEAARTTAARWPDISGLMLGRGAVADPALFRRLHGGPAAKRQELLDWHQELSEAYAAAFGCANSALPRMKEIWRYLSHSFDTDCPRGQACLKTMKKARSWLQFQPAAQEILTNLELLDSPSLPL